MSSNNKFMKNIILHIKYPYTALVIAIMWIGMAIIISRQENNLETLVIATAIFTIIISLIGFKSPK